MEIIFILNFIFYFFDILDILFFLFLWLFLYEVLVIFFEFVILFFIDEIIIFLRNLFFFCRRIESKFLIFGFFVFLGVVCGGGLRTDVFCFRDDLEDCIDMVLWLGVGWEMKLRWFWFRFEVIMLSFVVILIVLLDFIGWGCECCRLLWKL